MARGRHLFLSRMSIKEKEREWANWHAWKVDGMEHSSSQRRTRCWRMTAGRIRHESVSSDINSSWMLESYASQRSIVEHFFTFFRFLTLPPSPYVYTRIFQTCLMSHSNFLAVPKKGERSQDVSRSSTCEKRRVSLPMQQPIIRHYAAQKLVHSSEQQLKVFDVWQPQKIPGASEKRKSHLITKRRAHTVCDNREASPPNWSCRLGHSLHKVCAFHTANKSASHHEVALACFLQGNNK